MSGEDSAPKHVNVLCPICETSNFFPASQAGQTHPCDFCGNPLTVPEPPPELPERFLESPEPIPLAKDEWWQDEKVMGQKVVKITCPLCETLVSAPVEKAGREVPCPDCGRMVQMPRPVDDPGRIYGEAVPYAVAMDSEATISAEAETPPAVVSRGSSAILDRVRRRPPPEPPEPLPSTRAEQVLAPWAAGEVEPPAWKLDVDLLLFPWSHHLARREAKLYLLVQTLLLLVLGWTTAGNEVPWWVRYPGLVLAFVPTIYVVGGWFFHLAESGFDTGPQLDSGVPRDPIQWLVNTVFLAWYVFVGGAVTASLTFWLLFFLSGPVATGILLLSGYLWAPLLVLGARVSEREGIPVEPAVFQSVSALPGTWLATWSVPLVYLAGMLALLEAAAWLHVVFFWLVLPPALVWWFMLWGRWIGWCGSRIAPFLAQKLLPAPTLNQRILGG